MDTMVKNAALLTAVLLLLAPGGECRVKKEKKMNSYRVLMIIASHGFRDEEYLVPKNALVSAGVKVVTASSSLNESKGMLGAKVKPDILLGEAKPEEYDAVIFVGGAGSREYWDSKTAHSVAKTAAEKGRILGAICIAPVILAKAGLLKGKKATVYSSERNAINAEGAEYTGAKVQEDGNIITASGPEAAKQFGSAILKRLSEKK